MHLLDADQGHFLDTHDEADSVENVGLAGAVKASDSVEHWVEVVDQCSCRVGLKSVDDDLFDSHCKLSLIFKILI